MKEKHGYYLNYKKAFLGFLLSIIGCSIVFGIIDTLLFRDNLIEGLLIGLVGGLTLGIVCIPTYLDYK